jgi:hypothetical protein
MAVAAVNKANFCMPGPGSIEEGLCNRWGCAVKPRDCRRVGKGALLRAVPTIAIGTAGFHFSEKMLYSRPKTKMRRRNRRAKGRDHDIRCRQRSRA